MKKFKLYHLFAFVVLLLSACNKDDDALQVKIYGKWTDSPRTFIFGAPDYITTYTFKSPNYCKYECDQDDGSSDIVKDSLIFEIFNKKIFLYQKDGTIYRTDSIHSLTNSKLELVSKSGHIKKLRKDSY